MTSYFCLRLANFRWLLPRVHHLPKRPPSSNQIHALTCRIICSRAVMISSNMSYSVPHPSGDGNLELLSGISGFCKPGEVSLSQRRLLVCFSGSGSGSVPGVRLRCCWWLSRFLFQAISTYQMFDRKQLRPA